MKSFTLKTVLFFCPIILVITVEVLTPLSTFTFRPYEALLYEHSGLGFPFYPNHRLEMKSTGDLCFRSGYSIVKNELWITDKFGYRNNHVESKPDVIVIGDSFTYGTATTQDSILSNALHFCSEGRLRCYNMAPATVDEFIKYYERGTIAKPKVVIVSKVERDIPKKISYNSRKSIHEPTSTSILKDKASRFYSLKYLNAHMIGNNKPIGVQSELNKQMFFLNGSAQEDMSSKVQEVSETIEDFRDYFESIGVEFIYLPAPNKETVYFKEAGFTAQPAYLGLLHKELTRRNIISINTLYLFNTHNTHNTSLLYHTDDTHWNATGVHILAKECIRIIGQFEQNVRPND